MTENAIKDKRKPILQYNLNGNFIREWESIVSAAKKLKVNAASICRALKGKRKSAFGFIWSYKNAN